MSPYSFHPTISLILTIVSGHDETSVAVALSHVAHLLCLISRIWDLPLRYQTENTGGRVIVIDHILSNLSDSDRRCTKRWIKLFCTAVINFENFFRFPLVLKGQDRQRFQYGVFLLNKDIAQVCTGPSYRNICLSQIINFFSFAIIAECLPKIFASPLTM